jgi:hypothetical protein
MRWIFFSLRPSTSFSSPGNAGPPPSRFSARPVLMQSGKVLFLLFFIGSYRDIGIAVFWQSWHSSTVRFYVWVFFFVLLSFSSLKRYFRVDLTTADLSRFPSHSPWVLLRRFYHFLEIYPPSLYCLGVLQGILRHHGWVEETLQASLFLLYVSVFYPWLVPLARRWYGQPMQALTDTLLQVPGAAVEAVGALAPASSPSLYVQAMQTRNWEQDLVEWFE